MMVTTKQHLSVDLSLVSMLTGQIGITKLFYCRLFACIFNF